MTVEIDAIPADLVDTVQSHGNAVAAGRTRSVLADFLPDRLGQLIASADVPNRLKGAQVQSISDVGGGFYDAVIRYTKLDDESFELRSRWVRFDDGSWRVFSVRNIPATAPWMDITGPADDGSDRPHWDGLREGVLRIQRCAQCRTWIWSPRPICPSCHSFDTRWEAVQPVGTIYSWTRTWQPFAPESTGHLPYTVVLVELRDAGGSRVVGVLADADGVTPAIGAEVHGAIEAPPDQRHWPLLRWHLTDGAS
ncbi:MAG: OB-fold domain-containing protein [Mycobacterium sp.]|nr:OB-fold domain-containing protein [Mycobacterium sp.]